MPVYEIKYKTWRGCRTSIWERLMAFPRFAFMQVKGKRAVNTFFIMAWFPFILFLGYIYLSANSKVLEAININENVLPEITPAVFLTFLQIQLPFMFIFTIIVGPSLISRDLKRRALPMILSKPVNRWEYILGKFMVLLILLSALSWFQGFILFITQTAAAPEKSQWREFFWSRSLWVMPKILIFSLLCVTTMNLVVMALSSLTENHRFAGIGLLMYAIGGTVVGFMAVRIFNDDKWMVLSLWSSVDSVGQWLFATGKPRSVPPGLACVYILFTWGASLFILSKRVRGFYLHKE